MVLAFGPWFPKTLWFFLLLILWLKPLQYKQMKWLSFSLATVVYGILLWLGWWIFTLPLPLTDLYPGSDNFSYANYHSIFYDDHCAVMDEDSSNVRKFIVVSLRDGRIRQSLSYKGESYAQIDNWKYASGDHAQAFLFGNPPNKLLMVRNDSLLGYRTVNGDEMEDFRDALFYNDTEKCFEVVTRNFGEHQDSLPVFRYDEHFNLVNQGVFYVDHRKMELSAFEDSLPAFSFEHLAWLNGRYIAVSEENQFVVLKKSPRGDSLLYDHVLPVPDTTFLNFSGDFFMWRNHFYGVKTRKGAAVFHLRKNWLKDTLGDVRWQTGKLKLTGDGLVPHYYGVVFEDKRHTEYEYVYGKYTVRLKFYYESEPDEKDPGAGWKIQVCDTTTNRKTDFRLHQESSAYDPQIFLTGDTLAVFSHDLKEMARFNLNTGERLDKIDWKTHFYDRIYYFREKPSIVYTVFLLISYFFLPFMLLLYLISWGFTRKWFWLWFNLQRVCALYTAIALITLVQMCWRVF